MKIVIFGTSGKTGSLLLEQALEEGHEVIAFVRRAGSVSQKHSRLKVVTGNLSDTGSLKEAIIGADACISALGGNSLTKHAPEIIQGIDNIILQMEELGVKRFIYLSSLGAGESRLFMGPIVRFLLADLLLRVPLADHNLNEKRIAVSRLNWTVVRPGGLTNGPKTGKMKHGTEKPDLKGGSSISRANVASFMLSQLSDETTYGKFVWLQETV
jgi:putative NADH-flavin reductase